MKTNKDSWALSAEGPRGTAMGPSHLQRPACIIPPPSGRASSPLWPGCACLRASPRPAGGHRDGGGRRRRSAPPLGRPRAPGPLLRRGGRTPPSPGTLLRWLGRPCPGMLVRRGGRAPGPLLRGGGRRPSSRPDLGREEGREQEGREARPRKRWEI